MDYALGLLAVAVGFAVLNGANNGSTLVAIATSKTSLLPITAIGLLAGGVVLGPLMFGTAVATTLSSKLVDATGPLGGRTFLAGIGASSAVIAFLAWRGLPSSLTLATVGGLGGAGLAAGLHLSWAILVLSALMALLVPVGTALMTFQALNVLRAASSIFGNQELDRRGLRWFRNASFVLQSAAYGTNDGQRMLAILLVALRVGRLGSSISLPLYAFLAFAFGIGAVFGTRHMARGSSGRVAPADSFQRSVASVAASVAAFLGAMVGIPLSMSQTTSAALIGAHATVGARRVRWEEVGKLAAAWVFTLPAGVAVGAAGSTILGWAR